MFPFPEYDPDGERLGDWGDCGSQPGQINGPAGIVFDADDNLYLVDSKNDRVQHFTKDGKYLSSWGGPGRENGQFKRPWGISLDQEGSVYVADWGNERVQVLSPDGKFQVILRGQATISKWGQDFLDSNLDESTTRREANLTPDLPPHINSAYSISSQTFALYCDKRSRSYN